MYQWIFYRVELLESVFWIKYRVDRDICLLFRRENVSRRIEKIFINDLSRILNEREEVLSIAQHFKEKQWKSNRIETTTLTCEDDRYEM